MKNVYPQAGLLILFLALSNLIFAQTKIIAHKSHSGKAKIFKPSNYKSNFGLDPRHFFQTDSIIKISDTKLIDVQNHRFEKRTFFRDTTLIWENKLFYSSKVSIDSLKQKHPHIVFVGFDKYYVRPSSSYKSK